MAALVFPANPTVGDKYPAAPLGNGNQWSWNGVMWALQPGAPAAPAELPGLGGWADVTAVTGAPTKHAYTDAQGHEWVAYEWMANGSVTVTDGLIQALVVSGGAYGDANYGGTGGGVASEIATFPAGTHPVTVGAGGHWTSDASSIGTVVAARRVATGMNSHPGFGATGDAVDLTRGFTSSITGTSKVYGQGQASPAVPNSGNGGNHPTLGQNGAAGDGQNGVVIIRVPKINAKA